MASKEGYMKFLKKKMAEGGFPAVKVGDQTGPSDAQIASAAGLAIDQKGKQAPRRPLPGYAEGGQAKWGEIGGDPGYGQPYNRHNSSGEPHTNEYFEDEHPMSYMSEGGMMYEYNHGEPLPDPDHHEQDPKAGPNPSYSNQHGEPDPDMDHMMEEMPDIAPQPMAKDQIHPGMYAEGGMAYEHQGRVGEEENKEMHPDLEHGDAMDHEMANFAEGGKMMRKKSSPGGMAGKHVFAHALRKGMK